MSAYNDQIKILQKMGVQEVVEICKSLLPTEYRHRPYRHPELNNGISLLQSEDGMNAYMAASGLFAFFPYDYSCCRGFRYSYQYLGICGNWKPIRLRCVVETEPESVPPFQDYPFRQVVNLPSVFIYLEFNL